MIELWAAIGLTICDCDFNKELSQIAKVRDKEEALKQLLNLLREYGFRMSCYEAVDFLRFIKTRGQLKMALVMHNRYWYDPDLPPFCLMHHMKNCLKPGYEHPYVVFDNELGKNVIGAVDPMTGEPLNNVPEPKAPIDGWQQSSGALAGRKPRLEKVKPPIKEAKPKKTSSQE